MRRIEWWKDGYWWPPTLSEPPLTNIYLEDTVYVWYVLVEEGGQDLGLESWENSDIGELPEWFDYEASETGIASILEDSYTWSYHGEGLSQMAQFAMEHGIAPFQSFRIRMDRPLYYSSSYEYPNEIDVEHYWEVDKITPISDWDAARRWEHYFQECRLDIEQREQRRKWVNHILSTDPEFMWIDLYTWGGPYNSFMGDSRYGWRYTLHSGAWIDGHHETKEWCKSESRESREEALTKMVRAAKKVLPHLHGNKIRNLPNRPKYPRYSWKVAA